MARLAVAGPGGMAFYTDRVLSASGAALFLFDAPIYCIGPSAMWVRCCGRGRALMAAGSRAHWASDPGDPGARLARAEKYLTSTPPADDHSRPCTSQSSPSSKLLISTSLNASPHTTTSFPSFQPPQTNLQDDWRRKIWWQGLWLQERAIVSLVSSRLWIFQSLLGFIRRVLSCTVS